MTLHGFRAMARTILDEVLGYPARLHRALNLPTRCSHPNGRAYNRPAFLPERRVDDASEWADYLDRLRTGETPEISGSS